MFPGWVLGGWAHDELAKFSGDWWPSDATGGWLGPMLGDSFAVPAKQRLGCDQPALAKWAGECRGDGAEQGPVVVVDGWSLDLAA